MNKLNELFESLYNSKKWITSRVNSVTDRWEPSQEQIDEYRKHNFTEKEIMEYKTIIKMWLSPQVFREMLNSWMLVEDILLWLELDIIKTDTKN